MKIGETIKIMLHSKAWSEGELARRSGVPQPTIHRIITGDSKEPRHSNVEKIAKALGISTKQLGCITLPDEVCHQPGRRDDLSQPEFQMKRLVPVISPTEVGSTHYETNEWVPCPFIHGQQTFALKITGPSMYNPGDRRSCQEGDLIFVDPEQPLLTGSLCVALLTGRREAIFKEYFEEDGFRMLKPLNPSWPEKLIIIDDHCTFIGKVIGKITSF